MQKILIMMKLARDRHMKQKKTQKKQPPADNTRQPTFLEEMNNGYADKELIGLIP